MATFSPDNQGPPSYPYFWQQRTQEPRPNEAGAIVAKGIEETIRGGSQFVNAAFEKGIQNDIYARVDPIRDEYMNSLHVADQSMRGGEQTVDPLGKHPEDIRNLPKTLDTLGSARANNKLSQTDYDSRLNALAKEIRAKYPGYREYVDQVFQRATGRDSANQYIRSVIGDINSFEAGRADKKNKIEDMALTRAIRYAGGDGWYRILKNSGDDPRVQDNFLKWLSSQESYDTNMERGLKKAEMLDKVNKLGSQEHKDAVNDTVSTTGPSYWTHNWDFMFARTGMDNPKWQEGLNAVRRGENPDKLSAEDNAAIASHMPIERAAWVSQRARDLAPLLNDPDELSKRVENEAKLYFDPIANAFSNEQWGTAVAHKKVLEARADDKYQSVVNDKEFRQYLDLSEGVRRNNPAMSQSVTNSMSLIPTRMVAKYATDATAMMTQGPGSKTPKQAAEEAKAKNIESSQYFKSQIDLLSKIADKEVNKYGPEVTDALISNTFSTKNMNYIAMFDKDRYRTDQFGHTQFIPGQDWVFQQLTSQGIVDRVWDRSHGKNAEHPEYWTNMRNWAENDARHVFQRAENVEDPKQADFSNQTAQGIGAAEFGTRYYDKPALEPDWPDLHFNSETSRFRSSAGPADEKYRSFNRQVDQVNKNLEGLKNIWKKEGMDVNASTYVFLKSFNAQPGSLMDRMLKSIEAAHPNDR